MSYQEIRRRLPFSLSTKSKAGTTGYTDIYNAYDVAIGGVPFLLKIDENNPVIRGTAPFKKQQLDTSSEPGEQTLTGWWLRSQSSFHWGAGLKFGDPELDDSAKFRYLESEGVDVWTPGQVSLLPTTSQIHSVATPVLMVTAVFGGGEVYYRVSGNNVVRGTNAGVETTVYTGSSPITDITTDGFDVYVSTLSKIVLIKGDGSGTTDKWTYTATNNVVIGWTKQRMIAGIDNKVYEPSFGSSTLPSPLYTHPNASWLWTDIDEGPQAIYVSGYVGNESVIIKLTLDDQGAVPTLTAATVVAEFPTGELVKVLHEYLGTFLGIGTNKGIRVAIFQSDGNLAYGPLIETPSPVTALRARDKFLLAGYTNGMSDGTSGLLRVNVGTQLTDGSFPYARDLMTHVQGNVNSVAILSLSNLALIGIEGHGVYKESATVLEDDGFLTTAAQRYNTVWPKLFKRFNVRGDFAGAMSVATIDDKGVETNIVSIADSTDQTQDFSINYPDDPQEFLSLKFTLHRSIDDNTLGTVFRSYQLKAIPGGPRPRQFTLPLLCYDYERDRNEAERGYQGFALSRLTSMESLDSAGDVVLFEELGTQNSYLCTIEAIEFRQTSPRGKNQSKWGGILTVVLRTLSS